MTNEIGLSDAKAADARAGFARQGLMRALDAQMTAIEHGRCTIELPFSDGVSQHHGFFHGGIIGAIADNAGGFAALTMMPDGSEVVTLEYKVNFLRPAAGERIVAEAHVLRAGRQVTVTRVDVFVVEGGRRVLCAAMQQSLMGAPKALGGRSDTSHAPA